MCYDVKNRRILCHLEDIPDDVEAHTLQSADGLSEVEFAFGQDHLPYVFAATIANANKVGIIQDWIEEAIEESLNNLNVVPSDDFADDHWKGRQET